MIKDRIVCQKLHNRIASVEEAAAAVNSGTLVAIGGYTSCGYPKVTANELTKRKKKEPSFQIDLISGANLAPIDDLLGRADIISRRIPMNESKVLAGKINGGTVHYVEQQMNRMPTMIEKSHCGSIDVAIVEAIGITAEGYIIPTAAVGADPHIVNKANRIIVEINLAQPEQLLGLHDIYMPGVPPSRTPIPLRRVGQRIGDPFIRVNADKIHCIVASDVPDAVKVQSMDEVSARIVEHLFNFLEMEQTRNKLHRLAPLQTGFGSIAVAIAKGLMDAGFTDLEFFCGGLSEANMELIAAGKVRAASCGSVQITPKVKELLKDKEELFEEVFVLRNMDLTNSAETVGRLGVIALNSGIEIDIYGNVNSSHIMGSQVVNGIGGGANFAQNSSLSIILIQSETKNGDISTIVPMVSHHDINEHDVDIVITENGVADLRGKDDVERAFCIIKNCASTHYKERLLDYLKRAIRETGGHHPQILEEAFSWHKRFKESGSMKTEDER